MCYRLRVGRRSFKTYDYNKLKNDIYDFVCESDTMISTEELINWAKTAHNNVSIHDFDARYRKFITHTNNGSNFSLVYIVKDHHLFPMTDEKLELTTAKANKGGRHDLLKHMTDLK